MNLIFLFRRLVFTQVLLGVVAFCWAAREPGILLLAGALICLSWYWVEGPSGRPLPRIIINLGSFATVVWLLVALYLKGGNVILAMGQFTLWLQVVLLYAEKSNRDYGQLLVLSLLQMIGAAILSVQFVFGLLLAGYCVLALFSVLLLQLKATSDMVMQSNQQAAPQGVRVSRPASAVTGGYRWHFRSTALAIALGCVAVSAIVFVLIPRDAEVNTMALAGYTATGFNTQINLDQPAPLSGSRKPALVIQLRKDGRPVRMSEISPDGRDDFLVRGATMDYYEPSAHTWQRSITSSHYDDEIHPLPEDGAVLADVGEDVEMLHADITLRATTDQVLFSIYLPVWFDSSTLDAVTFNTRDYQLFSKEPVRGVVNYSLRSPLEPVPNLLKKYEAESLPRQQYLIGTRGTRSMEIDPRNSTRIWRVRAEEIGALTREVLAERGFTRPAEPTSTPDDPAIMAALSDWLRENFKYSLTNPQGAPGEDPLVRFLMNRREGHCELFAAGLAAMGRTVGIPTRVVTGYRASEYNRLGEYYVVRHAYAHAWTEAWLGHELGWVPFDSTPPAEVAAEHEGDWAVLDPARELYDYLEFLWLSNVVSYNRGAREALGSDMRDYGRDQVTKAQQLWVAEMVAWARDQWETWKAQPQLLIFAGLLVFFILVGVVSLLHSAAVRRRRMVTLQLTRLPRKQRRQLVKQLKFYLYMLDLLERHGHVRPLWQSPFSFAKELMGEQPKTYDPVLTLTEHFYEIRFGHRTLDTTRRETIRSHLEALEENLANAKSRPIRTGTTRPGDDTPAPAGA